MQGELARRSKSGAAALGCFERALAAAGKQSAHSLELRAATSMAPLLGDLGRRVEGRDLLAAVHGRFTAGIDTPDLLSAKALLDRLG